MRKTITIRVEDRLRKAIERKAKASGRTVSEVVRETLAEALDERPLVERIGHLKGAVELRESGDPWRTRLRERNWRP